MTSPGPFGKIEGFSKSTRSEQLHKKHREKRAAADGCSSVGTIENEEACAQKNKKHFVDIGPKL